MFWKKTLLKIYDTAEAAGMRQQAMANYYHLDSPFGNLKSPKHHQPPHVNTAYLPFARPPSLRPNEKLYRQPLLMIGQEAMGKKRVAMEIEDESVIEIKIKSKSQRKNAQRKKNGVRRRVKTDPNLYIVEKIIDHRGPTIDQMSFLVRWQHYRPADDTWEPYSHLKFNLRLQQYLELKG
jgi:hypothetical protein